MAVNSSQKDSLILSSCLELTTLCCMTDLLPGTVLVMLFALPKLFGKIKDNQRKYLLFDTNVCIVHCSFILFVLFTCNWYHMCREIKESYIRLMESQSFIAIIVIITISFHHHHHHPQSSSSVIISHHYHHCCYYDNINPSGLDDVAITS